MTPLEGQLDTPFASLSGISGWRFDRYVIEGLLGEGGMGQVYRAYDPKLDRMVALKVLFKPGARPEEATDQLLREARLAAKLEHPNVVAIYDTGKYQGAPFIVMEFVKGKSLGELAQDPTVSLARKVGWLLDLARALAAAHRRGLVHRDIKPGNVLVREDDDVAKVFDFGLARRFPLAGELDVVKPSGTKGVSGTPFFMAPEELRGQAVDGRADQFGWGVVAYMLLAGVMPWSGRTFSQIVFRTLTLPPDRLEDFVPGIDERISATITRTLGKVPAERFESTDELVRVLELTLGEMSFARPGLSRAARPGAHESRPPEPVTMEQVEPGPPAVKDPGLRIRLDWEWARGVTALVVLLVAGFFVGTTALTMSLDSGKKPVPARAPSPPPPAIAPLDRQEPRTPPPVASPPPPAASDSPPRTTAPRTKKAAPKGRPRARR